MIVTTRIQEAEIIDALQDYFSKWIQPYYDKSWINITIDFHKDQDDNLYAEIEATPVPKESLVKE